MAGKKIAQKGKKLKDFKLRDQNGQDFHLTDYKGKKVLLSFHPIRQLPDIGEILTSLKACLKV